MIAYERIVASDGYEVALFPLPYLYMSQDEGGDYSHVGTYNIDFLGYGASGRIYNAPIYAPCTMKVVAVWMTYQAGNRVVFESVDKVHLANGQLDYLTISFAHDSNPSVIGQAVMEKSQEITFTHVWDKDIMRDLLQDLADMKILPIGYIIGMEFMSTIPL